MSKYTKTELLAMEKPFVCLIEDGDSLAENYEELEQLSAKEKINLATKILLQCPDDRVEFLQKKLAQLKETSPKSFIHLLGQALKTAAIITAILNPDGGNSCELLEENVDLFNQFHPLADAHAIPLASALASNLSLEGRRKLFPNVQAFSNTKFAEALGKACVLKDQLDTLNSDTPCQAFISADFNPSLYHQFPVLVTKHLTDIKGIAQRLADSPEAHLGQIAKQLEQLTAVAYDNLNLFKEMNRIFGEQAEKKRLTSGQVVNPGNSRNSWLAERSSLKSSQEKLNEEYQTTLNY
ncbi:MULTISPECIES: hypothetical protein [unclassified Legionella]|uniref:hypothetical protein n=1 Tax=unclassified Legionella TaxID=2622702 RepID=UPI001054D855|nr:MULTISPECIES: hypothetical protein [unclassified Legionella]MDI9817963.1 hypothetical protein [Legionella sp. PL877]